MPSEPLTTFLVLSFIPSRLFGTKVAHNPQPDSSNPFREKTRPATHKPKHSIENTPILNIVHISTTPWPWSRQALASSQITNQLNIRHFRLILPSSLCISLRPSRRAISSRQTPMSKDVFLPQNIRQIPQAGCTHLSMESQQRPSRVSTESDHFITHRAPLEPISVVRFTRYCGRRHHSLRQLRFVPLLINVWRAETYDKRAPGDMCCLSTVKTQ